MTTRTSLYLLAGGLALLLSVLWLASRPRRIEPAITADGLVASPIEEAPAAELVPAATSASSPVSQRGPAAPVPRVELASTPVAPAEAAPSNAPTERSARVRGRCVGADVQPLAGVEITGFGVTAQRSGDDGTFALELDLGAELRQTRKLEFARAGLGTRRIQVLLLAGAQQELDDVVLLAACRVTGRVVDARGEPLAASVRVEEGLDLSSGSRFTGPSEVNASTTSAADGSFAVEDIAAGRVRAWAGLEDWLWSASEPIELAPGEERAGLELVLEPLAPEDTIRLTVLDPHGAPVPRARVNYHYETEERSGSGSTQADEQGSLDLFLDVRATYSFQADDPEDRFRPAIAWDVQPGTHDLVLQLGEKRTFRVRAETEDGTEVETFGASVQLTRGGLDAGHELRASDGVIAIVIPPEAFELVVDADGFEIARIGPYQADSVPDHVVARLRLLPGIRGRVHGPAGPVSGAKVSLHAARGRSDRYIVNGFLCWVERFAKADSTTNADGEYALTLRASGEWYVRAEAAGYAPRDVGPLQLEAGTGARDIDVTLGRGGGIEGRVQVLPGEEPSGHVVGLSRGDGHGFTGRTDASGEFHFTGLTPGTWQVVWRQDEIRTGSTTMRSHSEDAPSEIPWDCEVREGETTRFDLDLRTLRVAVLEGRFRLGKAVLRDWSVALSALDDLSLEQERATLDPHGRFRLTTAVPGRFRLDFSGGLDGNLAQATAELVLSPGDNAYDADVPIGAVRGTLSPDLFEGSASVRLVSEAQPGLVFSAVLQHDAAGRFALASVPAGSAHIDYRTSSGAEGRESVAVPHLGTVAVRLP